MNASAQRVRAESPETVERRALLAARTLVDRMRTLYRELERLTNAPIAVHRALACIDAQPGLPASRLALALGMQRPAVSHILKYLAQRDWIERVRSESDQRSVRIFVTPQGRQLIRATAGRAAGTLQRAVARLQEDELCALAVGLEALLANLPDALPKPAASRKGERNHR